MSVRFQRTPEDGDGGVEIKLPQACLLISCLSLCERSVGITGQSEFHFPSSIPVRSSHGPERRRPVSSSPSPLDCSRQTGLPERRYLVLAIYVHPFVSMKPMQLIVRSGSQCFLAHCHLPGTYHSSASRGGLRRGRRTAESRNAHDGSTA